MCFIFPRCLICILGNNKLLTFLLFLFSCPHFRNEVGGEGERLVALSRSNNPNAFGSAAGGGGVGGVTSGGKRRSSSSSSDGISGSSASSCASAMAAAAASSAAAAAVALGQLHTPNAARGFGLFNDNCDTFWRNGYCPYRYGGNSNIVERLDQGATFYKDYFYGQGKRPLTTHMPITVHLLFWRRVKGVAKMQHEWYLWLNFLTSSHHMIERGHISLSAFPNKTHAHHQVFGKAPK